MGGDSFDLRDVLGLLRRRIWLIVAVAVVAIGLAGIALLALKPVYTATALVLVDPSKKNLLNPEDGLGGSGSESLRVDSEVELVKSETTLLAVARELDLASDPEFGLRLGLRDTLMAFLRLGEPKLPTGDQAYNFIINGVRDAVTVQRRGLTFLIAVDARSARPEFAATLANAIARKYIQQQLEAKVASTLASRDIIDARIADASSTVLQSERAFDDFIDSNLPRISDATGRSDFATMRQQIDSLTRTRSDADARIEMAELSLSQRDWNAVANGLKDDAVANLEQQREQLLSSLEAAGEGSQTAIDLRAELGKVESNLEAAARGAVTALKQNVADTQARVSELRTELRGSILGSDLPSDILTSIYELQQRAEIARAQYQTLLTRQKDLDTQAFLQVADSRVASAATPPTEPSFPNPRLILLLAGFIGVAIGVGLAFLVENFVGGFSSEAQTESILKLPVVSAIPRQRPLKRAGAESFTVADALVIAPLSVYSESIRRVRIGLEQALRRVGSVDGENKSTGGIVIAVTSAAPNEGKTTISLSLARAYALAGLSTILIDCDLRKPSVHRQLGMDASEGLLDYLTSNASQELRSIVTVDDASGAQVVLGSRRSDVATDQLIAGRTFSTLVNAAKKNFDVVILDTPPIGPVVDGLYLAGMADAIVFVVKWSATPQQEVRGAIASLTSAKREHVPMLVLLNQQGANPSAYKGRYAGYYAEA
jgi:capsular exopolysaccharide synthesis family protein